MDKTTFFTGQPVFTQLLKLIPRSLIKQVSARHASDRYCKTFMAYDHLVSMLYASFFQCTAIRELITGLQANAGRLQHLGLKSAPCKSTLSDANKRRSAAFFEDLYHQLYKLHFGLPDSRLKNKEEKVFIVDSTTISLFSAIMQGAGTAKTNGKKKGGAKAHIMLDAFHDAPAFISITEAKEHDLVFLQQLHVPDHATVVLDKAYVHYDQFNRWDKRGVKWVTRLIRDAFITQLMDLPPDEHSTLKGVLRDRLVILGRPSNRNKTPLIKARIIDYFDSEKQRTFSFITNDLFSEAFDIAELYKRRWQIELLFKRIKQRYPLKYFLGDNPNAIQIQIWAALICDLLVKIIQNNVNRIRKRSWAYAAIFGMIRHHLMTYIDLKSFLINPEKTIRISRIVQHQFTLFEQGAYLYQNT